MKPGLKRIEATLHDLKTRNDDVTTESGEESKRSFSFRISIRPQESPENSQKTTQPRHSNVDADSVSHTTPEANLFPQHSSVSAFPAQENGEKTPTLPKFKTPSFSNHRHGANPALAMNMLQEIQDKVADWQLELQKIIQQIQDIYLEGPIINGWLESNVQEPETVGTATLRHAEVERLMNYVEEICASSEKESYKPLHTDYRLCGVDTAGQVWSRPCPVEQVPSVSIAIARHQRLRQLLGRKQDLENRLSQLAETLVMLHSHIQQS
ncbi:hypothetical protein IQ226_21905 [Dolichospermum sp. LEGE 00240]|jgi:hypothetical protein|uniref:hypothetical protein n=1 Tax=Dolichospermum sp. LEGE 00240 TaxID=1828603 RepID=UPI001880C85A|nr:hypothetical protein [Dolichospermum sp. LEGE 00240]MBE9251716.1 hypothetical protein [Dolichospermum sp. LEGE 00240]MDM3845464.1 hypothetical protein [Aphanizomenon gracile PMC638.10]MDM3852303.1 hypothetical protein [Aphanizomenon gracile PMC627.10]MDM3856058.1 hypothetical protein [Aphanizomenon gracile PMC649.10]